MKLSFATAMEQRQILSERQLASLDILALPMWDLVALIEREYEENPLLEHRDDVPIQIQNLKLLSFDDEAIQDIPAPQETTPEEIILSQLPVCELTNHHELAYRTIARYIDDNGYLVQSLEEIHSLSNIDLQLLKHCLSEIQRLEPPGIGARSLEECLCLQVDRTVSSAPLVRKIVQDHLRDVACGHISVIAQTLKTSVPAVRACIQIIKSLNPKPLNGLIGEPEEPILPDIIITRGETAWHVAFNDNWVGRLEISDYYAEIARRTQDAELRSYLKEKANRVHFLNDAIERRRATLIRIGEHLAVAQSNFFLHGGAPNALTMRDMASALGIHTSTVSRAVHGKFVQYPGGVREIRSLFMQNPNPKREKDDTTSGERIMAKIREFIDAEDKCSPLSDDKICTLLKQTGNTVSRRTVAKYRDRMAIPGMHGRRK